MGKFENHSFGALILFVGGVIVARFFSGPIGATMIGLSNLYHLIFIVRNWNIMGPGAGRQNIIMFLLAVMVFLWAIG